MPRKPKKTREEASAEDFFPVESDDVKYAVEKPSKQPEAASIVTIEKEGGRVIKKTPKKKKISKKNSGKSSFRKTKSKIKKARDYKPKKIKLKPNGYELIITEKPQAALKIASALGKVTQKKIGSVPYYEVDRLGKKIVVACAVGHLFTLTQISDTSEIPIFDVKWIPNHLVKKTDFSKKYYDALSKLVRDAGSLTVATDYDIEGEVIGLNVIRFIAGQEDASRMKFSTLTSKELNESYEAKSTSLNWGQAIAGETRHYLDWFYGINLSRALMNSLKSIGKFKIMSIGRVQGPTLNLIVQKEKQILEFKPQPYWQIFITLENQMLELMHSKDIFKKSELEKFKNLKGKIANVKTEKKQQTLQPNAPFNLTTLQTEAYRIFGINPGKTLQLAQNLYLAGLISYPRTSSQKLPPSVEYKEILNKLAPEYNAEKLISREIPLEGKKIDPAHPSIYPTGNSAQNLSEDEKKIYDLVVRRFLSLFCEDAIIENKTILAEVDIDKRIISEKESNKEILDEDKEIQGEKDRERDILIFTTKGSIVINKGWLNLYPTKIQETKLPDIDGKIKISGTKIVEKETQPPKRYSQASLISELEKRNLGTKATRASIIETLYQRGYIEDQSIKATPLGISLIKTLEKHSPIIIDEALTRKFEKEMDSIQTLKHGFKEKEEKVIAEAKRTIIKIVEQFKKEGREIGTELLEAQEKIWQQQRDENQLEQCQKCKKGNLQILYSKKIGRYFIGCSNYPECKNTYSLPPNSLIKRADKSCDSCGFPMLLSIKRGKRPWTFCFNPECSTNKERLKKYNEKKEKDNYS